MNIRNQTFSSILFGLVLWISVTQTGAAQTFKLVPVQGNVTITQVASGGRNVWALAANGNPYIYSSGKFIPASSISLSQIAVGGGDAHQPDTIWGLDSAGNIYKATGGGTSWTFAQMPGVLSFISAGIGYIDKCHPYEVWGLNPAAQIYRFSFCKKNWDLILGTLNSLSIGGGDVWGVNGAGQLFWFDFSTLTFIQMTDKRVSAIGAVAVAPAGAYVSFYYQFGLSAQVAPPNLVEYLAVDLPNRPTSLSAGGDGVWGLNGDGAIYRLRQADLTYVQIPGTLKSISVGSGAGVWGINPNGQVFVFSTP
jgi:virginiamycin B lyase